MPPKNQDEIFSVIKELKLAQMKQEDVNSGLSTSGKKTSQQLPSQFPMRANSNRNMMNLMNSDSRKNDKSI